MKILKNKLTNETLPATLRVYQITGQEKIPACHVYMEAPVFTPDSKRMVLHQAAHPHGPIKEDENHAYLLCDLENNAELTPLTLPREYASTSPAVSLDGQWFYYFIDHTEVGKGELMLKRVRLNGNDRETLFVIDSPIRGTRFRPSLPYPLTTISADGKHLALQVFLGDGYTRNSPFGLLVFDLEKGTCSLPLWGPTLCNMHAQYCRTIEPERIYDLLIQENHGSIHNCYGKAVWLEQDGFTDLHVIQDDSSNLRDLPIGGSQRELCSGHQCWRGDSEWVISSVISLYGRARVEAQDFRLMEARPVAHQNHRGAMAWWGERNEITGAEIDPHFNHFGVDAQGCRLITEDMQDIRFASLKEPGEGATEKFIKVATTNMHQTFRNTHDSHPFISPDGKYGFFNSNESGQLQAYMIEGLDALA